MSVLWILVIEKTQKMRFSLKIEDGSEMGHSGNRIYQRVRMRKRVSSRKRESERLREIWFHRESYKKRRFWFDCK